MKILILHRIPYHKIDYHRGINHDSHDVTYVGTETALSNIPSSLNCHKLVRSGVKKTADEVISILEKKKLTFDLVLSLSEYELLDAAQIREYFQMSGATIAQVEKVRNKLVMKTMVAAAGICVPGFLSLPELIEHDPKWQSSIVLKPIDGASSENIKIFSSTTVLLEALRQGRTGITVIDQQDCSNLSQFEVEEFIQGPIFHFDGLVQQGEVKVIVASQYVGNCLEFANGKPLGSVQIDLSTQARNWALRVLQAVELTHGSFHLEAILRDKELVFLEVANRVGGADVVDTFEMATGIHLPSEELKIYLSEILKLPKTDFLAKKYGWYVFPGHHYQFDHCHIVQDNHFRNNPFVIRWHQLSATQKLPKHITYQSVEVPLAGLIGGNNSQALQKFLQELFTQIKVEPLLSPV
jgi:biotin carboxylase